jgi:hypothetical protein
VKTILKGIAATVPSLFAAPRLIAVLATLLCPPMLFAQVIPTPPPSTGGFFPLSEVHRGLTATAWTVFSGTTPEPMDVEVLGVLRGARGPGHDMILARLKGPRAEYTGVVAGMSGSPVYVGTRLLGSVSYRFGEFSKEAIAGITPIEQMLEVRDLPIAAAGIAANRPQSVSPSQSLAQTESTVFNESLAPLPAQPANSQPTNSLGSLDRASNPLTQSPSMTFQAIETPLSMSGFHPEAIRFWQQQVAGTGLEYVAGGGSGSSLPSPSALHASADSFAEPPMSTVPVLPGSAVSMQIIRGDLEMAATCTVTYVDPKQLLACGHPVLQAGPVSIPMTTAEVVVTLASPFSPFKIINTGETIGAFTEDRDAAIRGVLGERAHMIPLHIAVHSPAGSRELHIEMLDLPALTAQAMMVSVYESLLESIHSTMETSYHIKGAIDLDGARRSPIDLWASASDQGNSPVEAAIFTGLSFARIYQNGSRQGNIHSIDLQIEEIPGRVTLDLESAHIVSSDIVHAGDTVIVEATLRPWHQPTRNLRIPVTLPARLESGNLRLLVSDAGTLDRTMDQPRLQPHAPDLQTVLAQARAKHPADHLYISLLIPETQAGVEGHTLTSLPLSMANALEPLRGAQEVSLNGESAAVSAEIPVGGVVSGFQILNLHIDGGGGLN